MPRGVTWHAEASGGKEGREVEAGYSLTMKRGQRTEPSAFTVRDGEKTGGALGLKIRVRTANATADPVQVAYAAAFRLRIRKYQSDAGILKLQTCQRLHRTWAIFPVFSVFAFVKKC